MEKVYLEKVAIFLFIVLINVSCTNHRKIFSKFEEKYPLYKLDSFTLIESVKLKNLTNYNLMTEDSNKVLSFSYITKDYKDLKRGGLYFDNYQEKRIENDTIYVSAFDEKRKLLYSFMHTDNRYVPSVDVVFLKGKYYYTFLRSKLTKYQKKFFENHKDSITNNLVNKIPLAGAGL